MQLIRTCRSSSLTRNPPRPVSWFERSFASSVVRIFSWSCLSARSELSVSSSFLSSACSKCETCRKTQCSSQYGNEGERKLCETDQDRWDVG
jgi:hypothetical protein